MAYVQYITHNGLSEPLGRSQVLPYIRGLARRGHVFRVFSFEPPGSARPKPGDVPGTHSFHIRKKGTGLLSKIRDFLNGMDGVSFGREVDLIHCRGYLPTAMGMFARAHTVQAGSAGGEPSLPKIIFDMRGFLPQEYLDAGHWKVTDFRYLVAKLFEARFLTCADGIVVLTSRARESLLEWYDNTGRPPPPIEVIPCCVDMNLFKRDEAAGNAVRRKLGFVGPVMVYSGSLGSWYMAREMAQAYAFLRKKTPSLCFLALTQSSAEPLKKELSAFRVLDDRVKITQCDYQDVPAYLSAADLGISFIQPAPSKAASSPTKIAEYLSCGLPVLANSGVGDLDDQARGFPHIHLLQDLSEQSLKEFAVEFRWDAVMSESTRAACCGFARTRFDLEEVGVELYHAFYKKLLGTEVIGDE